jgi:hypothetical protein
MGSDQVVDDQGTSNRLGTVAFNIEKVLIVLKAPACLHGLGPRSKSLTGVTGEIINQRFGRVR